MDSFNDNVIVEFRANKGVVGGMFENMPLLLLTTTGRKSGQKRTSPIAYTRDQGRYVIAASKGGADDNPLWFLNLEANPQVTVEVGTESFQARAIVASPDERDRLYAAHADAMPGFRDYEEKTDRKIPVILLEPAT